MKDKFCSYCGTEFGTDKYPKNCRCCNNITWKNPIPIVVGIIIGYDGDGTLKSQSSDRYKVLIIQRAQDPDKEGWAFPGGFMEMGETVEEATAREIKEETEIDINKWYHHHTALSSMGNLLMFMQTTVNMKYLEDKVKSFKRNSEVLAMRLVSKAEELTFPTHTEVLKKVFWPIEEGLI